MAAVRRRIAQAAVLAAILGLSWWLLSGGSASVPAPAGPVEGPEPGANPGSGRPAGTGPEAGPTSAPPAGLAVADARPGAPAGTGPSPSAADLLPDEPKTGPFRGTVVDEKGVPVPRAVVRVASGWGRGGGVDPAAFPVVTTGADGRFSFEAADDVKALRVHAIAEGKAPLRPDEEARRSGEARVVLVAACELRVRVLDAKTRDGVPGAVVRAYPAGRDAEATNDLRERLSSDSATTDGTGRATLRVKSGTWDVLAVPREHARTMRRGLLVPADGLDATIEVTAGRTLRGRVLDPQQRPVSGARVHAWAGLAWEAEAVTAPDGSFTFANAPPDALADWREGTRIVACADGFAPGRWPGPTSTIFLAPGTHPDIVISLSPWIAVSGTVERVGGDPAQGAAVTMTLAPRDPPSEDACAGDATRAALTDDRGGFLLERAAPGAVVEVVLASGDGEERGAARIDAANPVLSITLSPPAPPRGASRGGPRFARGIRVVDAAGNPVVGALVGAGRLVARYDVFDSGRTGPDGVVHLQDLPAGRVLVVVHPPQGPAIDQVVDVAGAGAPDVTITIPSGLVTGRVLALDGSPARTEVILVRTLETPEGGPGAFLGSTPVRTDESGAFAFTGVGQGTYVLQTANGADRLVGAPARIRAGDVSVVAFVASLAEETALFLEADLLEADDGKPVVADAVNAYIDAPDTGKNLDLRSVPDSPGLYRSATAAPPGVYEVTVSARGRRPAVAHGVRFPQGTHPPRVSLRLERRGRIVGRVLDAEGRPVPGATVRAGDRTDVVGPDGEFDLAVADDVDLSVTGDFVLRAMPQSVRFRADETVRLDLHVQAAGAILVRLPDARLPKRSVGVAAQGPTGPTLFSLDADWLRSHPPARTLGGLAPGRWLLAITWDGTRLPPREVDVVAGVATPVDVSPP